MNDLQVSFEEAFDHLWGRAFALARRLLGSEAAAEDVTAEALARAWLHWKRVGGTPWRDGWVLRVTANLAVDASRRRRRVPLGMSRPDVADEVVLRRAIVEALAALPRRQRDVVVLRYLCDLSEADTGAVLGVRPATVGVHLHRGLAALRSRLGPDQPDGGLSNAAAS